MGYKQKLYFNTSNISLQTFQKQTHEARKRTLSLKKVNGQTRHINPYYHPFALAVLGHPTFHLEPPLTR